MYLNTSKFRPLLRHKFHVPSLLLPPFFFSYLQALIHGFLWWWASSCLIFSLKWRLLSTLLLLHSDVIKIQEAKDSINEEDPRPTSSNGAASRSFNSVIYKLWNFSNIQYLFLYCPYLTFCRHKHMLCVLMWKKS